MRPLIAVDVDGVLNQLSKTEEPEPGWRDAYVSMYGSVFRIRHNKSHGEKLLALAADTGAELVWCTTWEDQANEHIAPLVGLPKLPVVSLSPGRAEMKFSEYRTPGQIKSRALQAYAATDEGVCGWAWFDDDARAQDIEWSSAAELLVEIDSRTGLQDKHFEAAREWFGSIDWTAEEAA